MPRLPGNFFVSQKSAQLAGAVFSLSALYAIAVDHTKIPTPHVCGASGIRSDFLPSFDQSSFSYRPSSQPRPRSPDSTSTTSQFTCLASTIAFTLACSPLYSTAVTFEPLCDSNGWLNAAF